MSELRPGTGYELLPEVPRTFVDYVTGHARQGDKGVGPSHASSRYDVDLSGIRQQIIESPFDRVVFEDSQYDFGGPVQKDQVTLYLGGDRMMAIYHELGPKPGYGTNGFLLWNNEGSVNDPDGAIVTGVLEQLGELEQAGRMVPAPDQRLPEAT